MRLKYSVLGLLILLSLTLIGWRVSRRGEDILSPGGGEVLAKPYDKYTIDNLTKRTYQSVKVEYGPIIEAAEWGESRMFYYVSEGRRISGVYNQPKFTHMPRGKVIMARGYVEKEGYKSGMGTKNAAIYFAKNGYETYAPDFSGYGESDPEDPNALGARLVKPVEILDLVASVSTVRPIYLWGHSNGGQIMLTVAEVLGKAQVTMGEEGGGVWGVEGVTLWAPVSKPFPYNILYYTDEASDSGKWLRGQVAKFEQDYDVFNYSLDRYLDWINLPIQIHQGSADDAVPRKWSDELVKSLKEKNKDVTYYIYQGADHNMKPNWDMVVGRDVAWFQAAKR